MFVRIIELWGRHAAVRRLKDQNAENTKVSEEQNKSTQEALKATK